MKRSKSGVSTHNVLKTLKDIMGFLEFIALMSNYVAEIVRSLRRLKFDAELNCYTEAFRL